MYIYLPNGYRNLKGVRVNAGIWSSQYPAIKPHWQEIVDSGRGAVLESAEALPTGKQALIGQLSAQDTIKKQYYTLTGDNSPNEWQTEHLLSVVIELQEKTVAKWDDSDNELQQGTIVNKALTAVLIDDAPNVDNLVELRQAYEELAGKRVYYGWNASTLETKIAELQADVLD